MKRFSNETMDIINPPYPLRKRMIDTYQSPGTVVFDRSPERSSGAAVNQNRNRLGNGFYQGTALLVILLIMAGVLTVLVNFRKSRKVHNHAIVTSPVKLDAPESEFVPETSMDPKSVDDVTEADKDSGIDPKVTEFLRRKPWYTATYENLHDDNVILKTLDEARRVSISSESSSVIKGPSEEGGFWDWLPVPQEFEDSKAKEDPGYRASDDHSIPSAGPSLIDGERGSRQNEDTILDSSYEEDDSNWAVSPEAESSRHRKPTDRVSPDVDKTLPPLPGLEDGLEGLIWETFKYASEFIAVPTAERTRVLDICDEHMFRGYPSAESFEGNKNRKPLLLIPPQTNIKSPHLSRFFLKRRTRQAAGATAQEMVYTAAEGPPWDKGW